MRKKIGIAIIFIFIIIISQTTNSFGQSFDSFQQQHQQQQSGNSNGNSSGTTSATHPDADAPGGQTNSQVIGGPTNSDKENSSGTTSATHPDADAPGGQTNSQVIGGSSGPTSSSNSNTSNTDSTDSTSSDHPIYKQPKREDNPNSSSASLDDMMNDADDFVNSGGNIQYEQSALEEFSANFYNIMLTVGVAIAVIVGGVLGIKLMLASVEEKAQVKKLLVTYAIGCVIIFGGFGIWKLVVTILEGI